MLCRPRPRADALLDALLRAQSLLLFVFGLIVAVVGYALKAKLAEAIRGKAEAADVRALEARTSSMEARLLGIETGLRHMPSREDMQRLELALSEQRGEFRAMTKQLEGMHELMKGDMRRMELVDEFLQRERGK